MVPDTAASAANRFGLGARPGELRRIAAGPAAWLRAQLHGDAGAGAFSGLPGSLHYLREEMTARQARMRERGPAEASADPEPAAANPRVRLLRESTRRELALRHRHAAATPDGFAERLVRFWSNHFAVSVDKRTAALYAAPMEREAVRPNLFGRFDALLVAVETHPAMLRYLDNAASIGEDSPVGQRARRRASASGMPVRRAGLNENLAREILELHTLSVDGGYGQGDVTELARAITGWSVPLPRDFARGNPQSAFLFRESAHEDGVRSVLGRRYASAGLAQGQRILADLAVHPATALHLCGKLARHFVSDDPPPALVQRMAQAWQREGGALVPVYQVLVESPEAWAPTARKFKSPDDYLLSAVRAAAIEHDPRRQLDLQVRLGQPPFTPRSPAGWPDTVADWAGGDALWKRMQAASALGEAVPAGQLPALQLAREALGGQADDALLSALRGAGSAGEGYALLFASPAFQWRI